MIVGKNWPLVAPGVRAALTAPLEASGFLRITRAHRGFSGLLARFMMLPPEGDSIESRLQITHEDGRMRWRRQFGTMDAESVQTFRDRTYIEEAGPFRLAFRMELRGKTLCHIQTRTMVFGIPVPRFCGPVVEGLMNQGPDEKSWYLVVDIGHRWFGSICRYEGVMKVQ